MPTVSDLSANGATEPTVVEVLTRADAAIAERGWCQEDFTNAGRVCLDGAVRLVITGDPENLCVYIPERQRDLMDKVESVIAQAIGHDAPDSLGTSDDFQIIANWNDDPDRTVEDVRRVLAVARTLAGGAS